MNSNDDTVSITPLRLDSTNFVGPLPLVKQVLAHFLQLSKEAHELRPGAWTRQELYNTTADDLLTLCAYSCIPDNVVEWVKPRIVKYVLLQIFLINLNLLIVIF